MVEECLARIDDRGEGRRSSSRCMPSRRAPLPIITTPCGRARRRRRSSAFRCRSRTCSTSPVASLRPARPCCAMPRRPRGRRRRVSRGCGRQLHPDRGRSNMTEFAFSGLGLIRTTAPRPMPTTAKRLAFRADRRQAVVSVTDGMAAAGLGTDTGGSSDSAALCGIVGFKPTAYRVPTQGAFPLSTSSTPSGRSRRPLRVAPSWTPCWRVSQLARWRTRSTGCGSRCPDHGARRRRAGCCAGVRGGARPASAGWSARSSICRCAAATNWAR